MDIGKIGLIVTVIAVLLAVPLSVVANLLTPALQSWYGTTTQKRVRIRLRKLEFELQISEQGWTFTPAEWAMYRASCTLSLSLTLGVTGVFYLLFAAMDVGQLLYDHSVGTHPHLGKQLLLPIFCLLLAGVGFTAMVLLNSWELVNFRMNRALHSEEGREQIRKEIRKLTLKLISS